MINEFKDWFNELGTNAIKRKKAIVLKTGKKPKWTSKTKNKEIKEKFTKEGLLIKGIKPRSSNDRKAREWLYDLIWREFDSDNNFIGVKLVMEIELSEMKESGLIYDFNKILQSDADYKVFVFQQKTEEESKKLFAKLQKSSEVYKSKVKSSFLLCCWCWKTGTFIFKDFNILP
ncbi:MAG: hypothetical protein HFP78_00150 [Methylococcales symbiont of Hymedesmia sp. n. MRB-2018]|nr:MAG: hypothetical protein HFP78_00150 [Methylococcales symbiont of Hymedesmia sp. n. MRB-2018]MBA4719378.1 hypothetical protein [Nitrosopumilus sp.]